MSDLPRPGDLMLVRPPDEFVQEGHFLLWCLNHRCHFSFPALLPALVLSTRRSRIPHDPKSGMIHMTLIQMHGMLFRVRSDWLIPAPASEHT